MLRMACASVGDMGYHSPNRGNRREATFHKPSDDDAFVAAMSDVRARSPTGVRGSCLMLNHGSVRDQRWLKRVNEPLAVGDLQ